MISEIKIGDILECANCGKPIIVSKQTFLLDADGEYIRCNDCNVTLDVRYYHRFGKYSTSKETENEG